MPGMRYLALLCFVAGCGYSQGEGPVEKAEGTQNAAVAERCTSATLPAAWECCDEDGLLCSASGPVVCHGHHWEALTTAECERIAADPRRPEFRTYSDFCAMRWCPARAQ